MLWLSDVSDFGLKAAAEWASVITDDATLGEFIEAYDSGGYAPEEAVEAAGDLLAVPLSRLLGHEVTPLAELLADLVSEASDTGLLAAREFQQARPTWATLGRERGVTGEAVRRRCAKDVLLIRGLLASDRFRAVRWAARHLQAEFGLVVAVDSAIIDQWRERLGAHPFEILRWVAYYVYDGNWLLRGATTTQAELIHVLHNAAGDEWLVRTEDFVAGLEDPVRSEAVLRFLVESGSWRDIGEGWLLRWDGKLQVKAERVLQLVGRPMTPDELIEAIGYGSKGSLKNIRGSALVRIDKQFRLAHLKWGYEEYEGIATEIKQRIERGGGVASRAAMIEEFTGGFGVSMSSITTYLNLPIFDVTGTLFVSRRSLSSPQGRRRQSPARSELNKAGESAL